MHCFCTYKKEGKDASSMASKIKSLANDYLQGFKTFGDRLILGTQERCFEYFVRHKSMHRRRNQSLFLQDQCTHATQIVHIYGFKRLEKK